MYKTLIFILKNDSNFEKYFEENFIPLLNEISGTEIKLAKVESNLLSDIKFSLFCELTADSKDEMDRKMSSVAGRKLGKLLMESFQNVLVINVNYQ
ncbi:MAG: hypothetical protein NZM09_09185 [Ignavibacterium sp.]|nr:hypothetical protein [Ignavibacterium sp.]MDW8375855.1 hypothetical protein [Ignavibacteriales bacterium]